MHRFPHRLSSVALTCSAALLFSFGCSSDTCGSANDNLISDPPGTSDGEGGGATSDAPSDAGFGTATGTASATGGAGLTTGTATGNLLGSGGSSSSSNDGPRALPLEILESDLVQVSGSTLYVHNQQRGLTAIDVSIPEHPTLNYQLPDAKGVDGELYADDGHVVITFGSSSCQIADSTLNALVAAHSEVLSIGEPDAPLGMGGAASADAPDQALQGDILARLCLPGHLIASRLIGDTLYAISTYEKFGDALTWIQAIDVSNSSSPVVTRTLTLDSRAHEVHVNDRSIYLAQLANPAVVDPSAQQTVLRRVDISNGPTQMALGSTQTVLGAPQSRFHMEERDGTFRIVTFEGRGLGTRLTVLDANTLKPVGAYPHLAPGEDLHAVRFVDEKVYVVTYEAVVRRTDPLWTIDLKNPSQPVLESGLIIPGFSQYIFPRGDRLLAVGRGDGGRGVAVSLYNLTDASNPFEIERLEFGSADSFSEANLDFRGLGIFDTEFGPTPLLALPMTEQQGFGNQCLLQNSVALIDVNGDDLELRATLTQPDRIRRSLAVGDQLYLAGNLLVSSVDVSRRPQPWTSASLVVGDPNAPVVCLDEGDFLGNSSDALGGGGPWGTGGWGDDYFPYPHDAVDEDERTYKPMSIDGRCD